ncbi:amphi-Trp domain-containing protein [Paucisalibacillus globulus]|uniref:amphi-Trp domain-containing protein n=1 Tax=Paucisalibacillus globulus TaxID=351095 RepID=UPI000BB89104|nr:amphi-Trp domain-containing protein [Paucisalibacillus globulus]
MEENKSTSQKLVKHKEKQSVIEFATILEKMAKKLKEEGKFTFVQGTKHIEVFPSNQLKVEYEYEVKGDKHEFEIEFEWITGDNDGKSMDIE